MYKSWIRHVGSYIEIVVSLPPHIDIARRHRDGRRCLPELSAVLQLLQKERGKEESDVGKARPRLPIHRSECDIMVCCTVHW
jgi:hypothetical protein